MDNIQYKVITIHIGDNGIKIAREIWKKYKDEHKAAAASSIHPLLDNNGDPRAVYVNNRTNIERTMSDITQLVESITTLACFNIIADLDSPIYYDVLSAIKKKYTDAILLNICIMPAKKIVLDPEVDNIILYNISAISNFTDSTILIDYDTITKGMNQYGSTPIYTTDIVNKIADIISYYIHIMFVNESTRQEAHEIANNISRYTGIATLVYVDDATNSDETAIKLTENYLVGFEKSTILYRRIICENNDVIVKINKELVNETLFICSKIDTIFNRDSRSNSLPPRGLTIVIDTGIKNFFLGIKANSKIGKNNIIQNIYSNAGEIYGKLDPQIQLYITLSSFITHIYFVTGAIGRNMGNNTVDNAINSAIRDAITATSIITRLDTDNKTGDDAVTRLTEALILVDKALANIASALENTSQGGSGGNKGVNGIIIDAVTGKSSFLTAPPAGPIPLVINAVNGTFITPAAAADAAAAAADAATTTAYNDTLNSFDNLYINYPDIFKKVLVMIATVFEVVPKISLKNIENNFLVTLNVIYQIIKQNKFFILDYPRELTYIISLALKVGDRLPSTSPYFGIYIQLSEVEALNKVDLEILRLEGIDIRSS